MLNVIQASSTTIETKLQPLLALAAEASASWLPSLVSPQRLPVSSAAPWSPRQPLSSALVQRPALTCASVPGRVRFNRLIFLDTRGGLSLCGRNIFFLFSFRLFLSVVFSVFIFSFALHPSSFICPSLHTSSQIYTSFPLTHN